MSSESLLRTVVESFGAVERVVVDEVDPALLSVVHLVFEKGVLAVEAVSEDDSLKLSLAVEPLERFHDVSAVSPWSVMVGGIPLWLWTLTNQQGYEDGIQLMLRKEGRDIGFQLIVMATSLKPYFVIEQ